jgi:hypothetical protein
MSSARVRRRRAGVRSRDAGDQRTERLEERVARVGVALGRRDEVELAARPERVGDDGLRRPARGLDERAHADRAGRTRRVA